MLAPQAHHHDAPLGDQAGVGLLSLFALFSHAPCC